MAWVDIDVVDEGVEALIHRMDDAVAPPSMVQFMEQIVEPWQRAELVRRFHSEVDPTGKPWPPLAYMTQEERQREGYTAAHPILQRTGDLLHWMTAGGDAGMLPTGASIIFPTQNASTEDQEKYKIAQLGGKNPYPVPPRPILGWVPNDLAQAMALLEGWVYGRI